MFQKIIFLMGVSGSGKTHIGKLLAAKTGFDFIDADDYHPASNIEKMKSGVPLSDEDRLPWLESVHFQIMEQAKVKSIIIACSALKASYRLLLSQGLENYCKWFFLDGNKQVIADRLMHRNGHYMPVTLLDSQFETLEKPGGAFRLNIEQSPETIVQIISGEI